MVAIHIQKSGYYKKEREGKGKTHDSLCTGRPNYYCQSLEWDRGYLGQIYDIW